MPAPSKLGEIWADVRERWESDPRAGYAWVPADMGLPITGAAVRNMAIRMGWRKDTQVLTLIEAERALVELQATARRQRQAQRGNHPHLENCLVSGSRAYGITDDLHLLHVIAPLRAGMVLLRETMREKPCLMPEKPCRQCLSRATAEGSRRPGGGQSRGSKKI